MEDEDAERVAVVEALPDADPLPSHLASFERRKSMVQMEVSGLGRSPLGTSQ